MSHLAAEVLQRCVERQVYHGRVAYVVPIVADGHAAVVLAGQWCAADGHRLPLVAQYVVHAFAGQRVDDAAAALVPLAVGVVVERLVLGVFQLVTVAPPSGGQQPADVTSLWTPEVQRHPRPRLAEVYLYFVPPPSAI